MATTIDLSDDQVRALAAQFGTPLYVYSEAILRAQAKKLFNVPNAFGVKTRYAMKACPNVGVIRAIRGEGIGIDASSGYEVERAVLAGVPAKEICLTAQELPKNFAQLLQAGIDFNACSLNQLETIGKMAKESAELAAAVKEGIGVRLNPGLGSGHSLHVNVGGPASSFGIWRDYVPQTLDLARKYGLRIARVHSHIGAGADPVIWEKCAHMTLALAKHYTDADTVSLGGGFKVARMPYEKATDVTAVGEVMAEEFRKFARETGRKLKLELEPGTMLVACAAEILCRVIDICDTGSEGYQFLKVDSGMTEILRPSIYGSQHPFTVIAADPKQALGGTSPYLIVGHCCESGDLLTTKLDQASVPGARELPAAKIGDFVAIGGAGAYCSSMSTINYNSFPQAAEVMVKTDGTFELTRRRQTFKQMLENEVI